MRQENHKGRTTSTRRLDLFSDTFFTNAERPVWDHPARIGNRRIGEGLTDHGNLDAAPLEHFDRFKSWLLPLAVENIGTEEGEWQIL